MKSLLLLLISSTALAQVTSNFQSYPIGERASGMGGAGVALSGDAAGVYYNPAGAAFALDDSLAVTADIYGIVGGSYHNLFGNGSDFSFTALNVSPNSAASLIHFGKPQGDRPPRWVFCFGVFTPSNFQVDQRQNTSGDVDNIFYAVNDKTILAGPTLAVRIKDRFSLGLSAYVMFHTLSLRADFTHVINVTDFRHAAVSQDQTNYGLMFELGAQLKLNERWTLGLAIRSPTAPLAGSGTYFQRQLISLAATAGQAGSFFHSYDIDTQRIYPTKLTLGFGYTRGRLTLAVDLQLYMPHPYDLVTSKDNPALNSRLDNGFMANGSVGLEGYVTKKFLMRVGFYTDASSAPEPTTTNAGIEQVHLFGGTFGLGWVTTHTSSGVAIVAAGGPLKSVGLRIDNDTAGALETFVTDGTQWRVYASYATSYHF